MTTETLTPEQIERRREQVMAVREATADLVRENAKLARRLGLERARRKDLERRCGEKVAGLRIWLHAGNYAIPTNGYREAGLVAAAMLTCEADVELRPMGYEAVRLQALPPKQHRGFDHYRRAAVCALRAMVRRGREG